MGEAAVQRLRVRGPRGAVVRGRVLWPATGLRAAGRPPAGFPNVCRDDPVDAAGALPVRGRLPPGRRPDSLEAKGFDADRRSDSVGAKALDGGRLPGSAGVKGFAGARRPGLSEAKGFAGARRPGLAEAKGFAAVCLRGAPEDADFGAGRFRGAGASRDDGVLRCPGLTALRALVAPVAASFLGINSAGAAATGAGRHTTRSLPMLCTGAQPRAAQSAANMSARACLSSPKTLTLINSCADRARSVSANTAGLRPESPIITTGSRWCACARRALRWAELNDGAGAAGGRLAPAWSAWEGGEDFMVDPAIMSGRILLAP